MIQRWYVRGGALLLFATATLIVSGLDAAALLNGELRYGVDQDGNTVLLTSPAPVAPVVPVAPAPPALMPTQHPRNAANLPESFGVDQNGSLTKLAVETPATVPNMTTTTDTSATPQPLSPAAIPAASPAAPAQVTPASSAPVNSIASVARPATKSSLWNSIMATVSRGRRYLLARTGVTPASPQPKAHTAKNQLVTPPAAAHIAAAPATVSATASVRIPVTAPVPAPQKVATPAPTTSSPRYCLKIDSLSVLSAARPVEEKLASNGVTILDSRKEMSTQVVHRLVLGTFATREKAQACLRGVQPVVKNAYIMNGNGRYGVYCGSFYKLQTARDKAAALKQAGVRPKVQRESVAVSRTIILAGSYDSRDAAHDMSARLLKMGIPAAIVSGTETISALRNQNPTHG